MTSNPVGCFGSSFVWVFFFKKIARRWWLTPWIPALHLWVWGQPGLQELVPGQAPKATEQPCLENQKKKMCAVLENALSLWTRPLHTALTLREDAESPVGPSAWYVCLLRAFAAALLKLRGSYTSLATQSQIPFSLAFPRCLFTSEDSALILRIILA